MIKELDIKPDFNDNNLFLVKIKSNSLCYENYPFCSSFLQETNGKTTAYINILFGNVTLFCESDADFDELESFLKFQNANEIFCNKTAEKGLYLKNTKKGIILKTEKKVVEKNQNFEYNPDYKKIYNLLKDEFPLGEYFNFVSDFSFRLKNGFLKLKTTQNAVIFSGYETNENIVISALAVEKSARQKGEATKLLNSFLNETSKNVYVYTKEQLSEFYQKNGFYFTDYFFTGKVN